MAEQAQTPGQILEREHERVFLQGALAATAASTADRPRAVFVTGPAGSGRSTLLNLTADLAKKRGDFEHLSIDWPTGGVGPETLRSTLPAAAFAFYDARWAQLATLEREVEGAQLMLGLPQPDDLDGTARYRAVQAMPPQALHFLIRRIYTTYPASQLSEQAAMFIKTGLEHLVTLNATNLGQLRGFVEELQAQLSTDEWSLYLRPEDTLALALGEGVAAVAGERALLLTIDNYQSVEGISDRWLWQVMEKSGPTLWVLAGLSRPVWAENLTELRLAPLSSRAINNYFQARHNRVLDEAQSRWLANLTGGDLLAVGIAATLLATGASPADLDAATLRTPSDRLEGLFLHFVEESGLLSEDERLALYRLAALRQAAPAFLAEYAQVVEAAGYAYDSALPARLLATYPWLCDGKREQLHPALKNRLRNYLLVERRRFSQSVQEGIIEPARTVAVNRLKQRETQLVADESHGGSLPARARDFEWGERVADVAYYRFWLDEAVGWFFLMPRWVMMLAYNEELARRVVVVAEELTPTFYVEGKEFLPLLRILLAPTYSGGRSLLDQKLKAIDRMEELSTTARGRYFRAENLGLRPESGGSPEAEVRGLLKWFQARVLEEGGQFERTAPLYESILATNVAMPDLEKAASRAALYLASRYRLKGSAESTYSSLSRAVELDPQQPEVQRALFYQAVRTGYFATALKAADALSQMKGYEGLGEVYTIFALCALERLPEAQTELRTFLARSPQQTAQSRVIFQMLAELAQLGEDAPGLVEIVSQLPE